MKLKLFSIMVLLVALAGCDDFNQTINLGPGKIAKITKGEFEYIQDDGRVFASESSLYYDSGLEGLHCDSVTLFMEVGFVKQVKGVNCH